MQRVACLAVVAALAAGSCSTGDVSASRVSSAATSTTDLEAEPGAELLGHRWVTVAATGFGAGRDPTAFPVVLTFERSGAATTLTTTGCDAATYPVTFGPNQRLAVGAAASHSMCANPFDVGQALPNLLALPLRWSLAGDRLTLSHDGSSISLAADP